LIGALVVTHAMLRRLINCRLLLLLLLFIAPAFSIFRLLTQTQTDLV